MVKNRFAIVAAALSEDARRSPALSRVAGFAGMQFDAYSPGLSLPELSVSGRREFRHLLATHEQQLTSLRADVGPKGFAPGADVDRLLDRLGRIMETAAGFGSPLVCLDLGPLPVPPQQPKPKPQITPQQAGLIIIPTLTAAPAPETTQQPIPVAIDPTFTAQVDAALIELGRLADRYSVTVALRSELAGYAAIERAFNAANCPWFGIDLDPVAILRDDWSMDEVFSHLGSLIRHVRARDALRGPEHRTKPAAIGQGNTDWNELSAALDDAGYHGWFTIDPLELPNRSAAAASGLEYLRRTVR